MDPQNAPKPEYARAPHRWEELLMAFFGLSLTIIRVIVKLVGLMLLFLVALVAALTWGK